MQVRELTDSSMLRKLGNMVSPRTTAPAAESEPARTDKISDAKVPPNSEMHPQTVPKKQEQKNELNEKELKETIEELNKHFQIFNTRLSFSFDEENNIGVIKIQDRNSGEVIKQIPPQEMLDSLAKISDIVGLLVDKMM